MYITRDRFINEQKKKKKQLHLKTENVMENSFFSTCSIKYLLDFFLNTQVLIKCTFLIYYTVSLKLMLKCNSSLSFWPEEAANADDFYEQK